VHGYTEPLLEPEAYTLGVRLTGGATLEDAVRVRAPPSTALPCIPVNEMKLDDCVPVMYAQKANDIAPLSVNGLRSAPPLVE
jgi:hypothetical protein